MRFVEPGGEIIYITCSILPQENDEQVAAFLARHPAFEQISLIERWKTLFPDAPEPFFGPGGRDRFVKSPS